MNYSTVKTTLLALLTILILCTTVMPSNPLDAEVEDKTLSHVREGGTPFNPDQSLQPRTVEAIQPKDVPTTGLIESPAEYDPMQGVLFCFTSSYQSDVVTDLVSALTGDENYDEIAYVWVSSSSQQSIATSMFSSAGADMNKVEFIIGPMDSIWMRDYGPHFIFQDGTLCLVDSHYYQTRDNDNFVPTLLGDEYLNIPTYDMGLYYSGGNFQPGPNRSGYVTELVNNDNPSSQGFNESIIAGLYQQYQGIDTLHIFPQLPGSVDGTGHIDMWMNIVDENTVIISRFKPGSDPTAISITENAVPYMESLGFDVYRTPAWNVGNTHYTYTNAYRVNDRYFIPYYDSGNSAYSDEDDEAYNNFTAAAGPDVEVIPIDCYDIIPASGAIHCIVMQVPRRINETPAAHISYPDGGEILVSGTTQSIQWEATDTYNQPCDQIDLYYSTDDGSSYTFIASTTDTGTYDWVVPDLYSDQMRIKIVATAEDSDQTEAVSTEAFTVAPGTQYSYDFSTGAGVDKIGFGYQTSSWNAYIDGIRLPVSQEIDELITDAYEKIAYSDATGGDGDTNRYVSPDPNYYSESTHVYEFTIDEDITEIDAIDISWEGYADYCTQIELYVWNEFQNQWGNGEGCIGQNMYMDNWAGNIDGILEKQITQNIDHYINEDQKLTLLVYAERGPNPYAPDNPSFHDYISVTISDIETGPVLAYTPTSYDFHALYQNQTDYTTFEIYNDGSGQLNYTLVENCSWLNITPTSGNSNGEHDSINVTVNTTNLPLGSYHCGIEIITPEETAVFAVDLSVVETGTPLLDVSQEISDRGFPIRHAADGDWAGAQSFLPSYTVFTGSEIYLRKFGTPEFDLVVELRENSPDGSFVCSRTYSQDQISTTWDWFEVDFNDISITPSTDYFIVVPPAPSGVTTSFGYEWGYAFGDQYDDGSFWFTRDGGDLWRDLPSMYEFAFRTYGYD